MTQKINLISDVDTHMLRTYSVQK